MNRLILSCVVCLSTLAPLQAQEAAPKLAHRWVYVATNMLVDKNVADTIALFERAAKAGYNGIVLTDSKFMRWDNLPAKYAQNVRQVREAASRLKLDLIAAVFPIGYSEGLLAADPNLAEGLPVKDAPFVVRGGRLLPADDSCQLANGGFEDYRGNSPAGWSWADKPGQVSFIDTQVVHGGKASLRMQDIDKFDPANGHGRLVQKLKVTPFRYYHVSAWVKTDGFVAADEFRIQVLADKQSLNYARAAIAPTQDWKEVHVTFNSLDKSEVGLYLGVWGGKGGKLWLDDVKLEPGGLVNLVRRAGAPFAARSEDGQTAFAEGKDFAAAVDPLMGNKPWPGSYSVWHEGPAIAIPAGSRLKDGQKVLLSYYHTAIIDRDQVMCCMSEPRVYDILDWQAGQMKKNVAPDGYFMQHDEIRVQGWDESCARRKLTCGQILADNVKRCTGILARHDPGKPVYVWSDMFDSFHNAAKTGPYYLVKGEGPWSGSWEGLDPNVVIVNWHGHQEGRPDSLQFFAARGHRQILAGYYDGPVDRIDGWLADAAKVKGVIGVMYTTWRNDYSNLEKFAAQLAKTGAKKAE
jgi:hypothetical protein